MPEGDTLARLAASLQGLTGAEVLRTDFRWPSLATVVLDGARLTSVRSAGKYLLMEFAAAGRSVTLVSHLRMEGRWRAFRVSEGNPGLRGHRVRAVLTLRLGEAEYRLVGASLGELRLVDTRDVPRVIAHLGPDPLDEAVPFDEAEAARRLVETRGDASDTSIGAALLDQRRIAGVGNVIRSEVLFLAEVEPRRALNAVDPALALHLARMSRDVLRINADRSRRTTPADWAEATWVYGREGAPCFRCGTPVRREDLPGLAAARRVFWCPRCQR
ncbi:Fpg/Nei family DNA glycosylase [Falsarthrobacter nasiphocae]|uniref:DNA-(apurinic or apyrimidinic site) lyase n=1 Tax=Falsarthrobacter nasiphocae TaxID=189863 RepID=A0AAE3YH57_9MICC|nr:DNA-formamidopyrimidine glycosylase family protein [Falsarthrobacter nasiphocae]MDR6892197.1 endonuclease-8 [Falsarthrobacter nasiphocae]